MMRIFLLISCISVLSAARIGLSANTNDDPQCMLHEFSVEPVGYDPESGADQKLSARGYFLGQITNQIRTDDNGEGFTQQLNIWVLQDPSAIFYQFELPTEPFFKMVEFGPSDHYAAVLGQKSATSHQGELFLADLYYEQEFFFQTYVKNSHAQGQIAFSPSGRLLSMVTFKSGGKGILIFDLVNRVIVKDYVATKNPITSLAFHPDERFLVAKTDNGGQISILDTLDERVRLVIDPGQDLSDTEHTLSKSLVVSSDGRVIATSSTKTNQIVAWNIVEQSIVYDFFWFEGLAMNAPRIQPYLLLANVWGDLNILKTTDNDMTYITPFGSFDFVTSGVVSMNNRYIISGSDDGAIALNDAENFTSECGAGSALSDDIVMQISSYNPIVFYSMFGDETISEWAIGRPDSVDKPARAQLSSWREWADFDGFSTFFSEENPVSQFLRNPPKEPARREISYWPHSAKLALNPRFIFERRISWLSFDQRMRQISLIKKGTI